jgi:S1-C subfamily serine protease
VPEPSSGGNSAAGGSLAKVGQGVVIINTALQYSGERAAGTGMVINADEGLVLTNNHVIENSTRSARRWPPPERTSRPGSSGTT